MKKNVIFVSAAVLLVAAATILTAHPHVRKSVTASLPGDIEATITYRTVPSNEAHAVNAAVGAFLAPGGARLKVSGELKAGSVTLAAGDYSIGVLKNSDSDWALALYPGGIGRGETPDTSKLIKLDSMYLKSQGTAEHMLIDITPGSGKFEGKMVLTIHFGTMFCAGALT